MSIKNKIISLVCVFAMLFSLFATVTVSAKVDARQDKHWKEAEFSTDHAYSFAFVGDPQFLTVGDYLGVTEDHLKTEIGYIADTAKERKLEHVFFLGDITDRGYKNDRNLASDTSSAPGTGEWEIVQEAISQLDAKNVPYSLVRGNHDDYLIDHYFSDDTYKSQFAAGYTSYSTNATWEGGEFYTDYNAKWTAKVEDDKGVYTDGGRDWDRYYVHWNTKDGHYTSSIVNSYKKVEIYGQKYIFITIDFNPTTNVLNWVDKVLAANKD